MNEARYFLPHLLALSTSSPFWMGRDTGLKSYRTTVFRRFPAHRHPRSLRLVERVRELRQAARRAALHRRRARRSGGTCGRIRPSARSSSASATCRRAPRRDDRDRRARPGDHRQAVPAAHAQPGLPPLPPRADRGEQVARRALGHRRQADRLRQARRKCRCAISRSSCSSSSTTWSTSWAAGEAVEYVHTDPDAKAPAPTGSCRSTARPATCKAVVQSHRRRDARRRRSSAARSEL